MLIIRAVPAPSVQARSLEKMRLVAIANPSKLHICLYCRSGLLTSWYRHGHDSTAYMPMSPHPAGREPDDSPPTRYRFVEPVVTGRSGSSPTPSLSSSSNGYSSSSSSDSSPPQYPRRLAPEDPRGRGPQYDQAGPGGFPWIYNARMDVNPASYEPVRAGERPRLPPLRSLELPTVGKRH